MNERIVFAKVLIDEDRFYESTGKDGIIDGIVLLISHLKEYGVLLDDALICDDDDVLSMARYSCYLLNWVLEHSSDSIPKSPKTYDQWLKD